MAANQWQASNVIGVAIDDPFETRGCLNFGTKAKPDEPCPNNIGHKRQTEARDILRRLSATDATSDDFDEPLRELVDLLFCYPHRHSVQKIRKINEWKLAISNHGTEYIARRGGDTVVGEATDQPQPLLDRVADLTTRITRSLRLVSPEVAAEFQQLPLLEGSRA